MFKIFNKKDKWEEILPDIFYSSDYLNLWAKYMDGVPKIVLFENESGKIFLVFIKRKIGKSNFYDITSPYGCGGIHLEGENKKSLVKKFYKEFTDFCYSENIVSEFTRIHPYFFDDSIIQKNFVYNLVTYSVFIKLTEKEKTIEKKFRKGHKALIKKAIREGFEIKISRDEKDIEIFHKLYTETMKRRNASEFYFFPLWFIKEFFKKFKHSYIFIAYYKDVPIAASMFLGYNKFFHYYLSGSDFNHRKLGGSHLIIYSAIKFAKEKGFEILHLGGGMKGKDSLFLFKSGFSDLYFPYYVYGVVHNEKVYNRLVEERKKKGPLPENFYFPLYRAPLVKNI